MPYPIKLASRSAPLLTLQIDDPLTAGLSSERYLLISLSSDYPEPKLDPLDSLVSDGLTD